MQSFKKKSTFIIFSLFFLYLIIQHSFIFLTFDDFGHASLSYRYSVSNVDGHSFTFSQLLDWGHFYYTQWGGRVVYYLLFLIPLISKSIHLFMFIQAIVVLFTFFYVYKIGILLNPKRSILTICMAIFLFSIMPLYILRDSIYWASASVCYTWALLPTLILVYHFMNYSLHEKKAPWYSCVFLAIVSFFAATSFEQSGAATLCFIISFMVYQKSGKRTFQSSLYLPTLLTAMIGVAIQLLAPGNQIRIQQTAPSFSDLPFGDKIYTGLSNVTYMIFDHRGLLYLLIFSGLLVAVSSNMHSKKNIQIPLVFVNIICFALLFYMKVKPASLPWQMMFGILLCLAVNFIIYLAFEKKMILFPYVVMVAASIYCLILSPTFQTRTLYFFWFLFFPIIIFLLNSLLDMCNTQSKSWVLPIFLLVTASVLLCSNAFGYFQNLEINLSNDQLLKTANRDSTIIELHKLPNNEHRGEMPYEDRYDVSYIEEWMKEYYYLSEDCQFIWK